MLNLSANPSHLKGVTNIGETVLLVDDDEIYRSRLGRAFLARNFQVTEAGDYQQALDCLSEQEPKYAVFDLKMPGKSGLELVKAFRAASAATRIVIVTGYGSIATAIDAMRLGATYYLPKPADIDDIIASFQRADNPPLKPPTPEYQAPSLARAEWEHINRVLSDCGGNISEAARRLGIHRRSLQRKLQKYPPNR